jgi:alpha-1,3-rhamnosyl/mannosyltransferase
MRVIFNGLASLKPKSGVGHYIESLYAQLCDFSEDDEVTFYPRTWTHDLLRRSSRLIFSGKSPLTTATKAPSLGQRLKQLLSPSRQFMRSMAHLTFRKDFRSYCARHHFDLYHEPNFLPWSTDVPTLVTIHDLSVLLYPEWHPADRVEVHEQRIFRVLKGCRHFITDSEYIRQELIRHLGVAPERITAIHIGIRPVFRPLPKQTVQAALGELGLPGDYLLCVGTIEPRKNILTILKAYVDLPGELRSRYPLVLAGGWGWKGREIQDFYERCGPASGIIHCGYVPESLLPALYCGARALLYPSYYEGFGLPPIEMLACGGCVLASTAGAVAEVLQGHPSPLIDPHDVPSWRAAMQRILTDDDWVKLLRSGSVEFASRYTWQACAKRTWDVYRSVNSFS